MAVYAGKYGPTDIRYFNDSPAPNKPVLIRKLDLSIATLYTDKTKVVSSLNPVYTDGYGNLSFYVDPGEYYLDFIDYAFVLPQAVAVSLHPDEPVGTSQATQIKVSALASANLSGHRCVTKNLQGQLEYSSNLTATHFNLPIWITEGAVSTGQAGSCIAFGQIDEPSWNWTQGPLFLGANGVLTQTVPVAPAFVVIVGFAMSPTSVFVDRQTSIKLV